MSRVGKRPVKIVSGVKVSYHAPTVEVSGKGGKLSKTIPSCLDVQIQGDQLILTPKQVQVPNLKALHGLTRSLIKNMVVGVSEGYSKVLELRGVGYRAQTQGNNLTMTLGFSHPVVFELPKGITAKVENNTKITLLGADKELLGTVAAKLRKIRPPECYKGKGIRYFDEQVKLKQGKAAGAAAGGTT